jgi:hypothetical protein
MSGVIVGAIIMFGGIASIPLAYEIAAEYRFGFYLTLILIIIQMFLIGSGFFLVVTSLRFKKSAADESDNTQAGNIPAPTPNMPRRIEIIINDNGVALSTEGLSPQEIIAFLELTKHYVVSKHAGIGSPMDVVRRQ